MGILGMAGGQQPQQASSKTWLGMDRDRQDRLALALGGMSMHPNQALMGAVQDRIDDRRGQRQQADRSNKIKRIIETYVRNGRLPADLMRVAEVDPEMAYQQAVQMLFAQPEDETTTAVKTLQQRAAAAGLEPGTEAYREFMIRGGAASGMAFEVAPDGTIRFSQGGSGFDLNEGQSKSVAYFTRASGAAPVLDELEGALTSLGDAVLNLDPTGLVRGPLQSPDYQRARNAADEFLQAILRKDTGAAITEEEQELYGRTYIPMPGDGPEVIAQKREARARALEALKQGIPPEAMVRQERAIMEANQQATSGTEQGENPYVGMSDAEFRNLDISKLSAEEIDMLFEARRGRQ